MPTAHLTCRGTFSNKSVAWGFSIPHTCKLCRLLVHTALLVHDTWHRYWGASIGRGVGRDVSPLAATLGLGVHEMDTNWYSYRIHTVQHSENIVLLQKKRDGCWLMDYHMISNTSSSSHPSCVPWPACGMRVPVSDYNTLFGICLQSRYWH
jgi:hypothetical protein